MSWRIGYLQEYLKTNVKNTILPALNPEIPKLIQTE
jgi:hypothetical protein